MNDRSLPDDQAVRLPVPRGGWDASESLTTEDLERSLATAEVRCDSHGRTACASCKAPLKVVDWEDLHRLIEEIEAAAIDHGPSMIGSLVLLMIGAATASLVWFIALRCAGIL
jgi:hypothetical protein